ncbi:hypothetical protein GGE35_002756 [Rhizobium cellulosilyticum]|uniref:Uncharacterized protein n=1 Tax=Aliirhizobium cellulosilyticum TaxID=393664 RepID=A0A7W6XBV6_9HYPH|nr:hypothetical protein [Rhizobium cellulosilyticum]MBB4412303.1 hypothetical protein [Rhizobium cellulosilyticum]MBB4446934.1 hypothetical protein [Rhizobium cellulosilyticum]
MGGLVDVHVQLSRNADDKADYSSEADRLPRISSDPIPYVVGRSMLQTLGLVPESSELLTRLDLRSFRCSRINSRAWSTRGASDAARRPVPEGIAVVVADTGSDAGNVSSNPSSRRLVDLCRACSASNASTAADFSFAISTSLKSLAQLMICVCIAAFPGYVCALLEESSRSRRGGAYRTLLIALSC